MSAFRLLRCGGRETLRRLYSGPVAAYVDPIAEWYFEHGYDRSYSVAALRSVDRFGRWAHRRGFSLREIDERLIGQYMVQMPLYSHPGTRAALRKFLDVLRNGGVSAPPVVERGPARVLEADFKRYLVEERGLAARTVEHYTEAARICMAALFDEGRRDPRKWTAGDVLTFIRQHAQARRPVHMQQLCTGLRAFFRYLRFLGKTECDLAGSVPRIARWRLATLPKFLSPEQLESVLAHCDRYTKVGRRNYAVLMLLAKLGLRADEVRSLTLDDIDWHNGQLTIRGKGRPPEPMPLPVAVGRALAGYLNNGRPPSASRAVFVRMLPPHVEFPTAGAITTIAANAIRVAGINAPVKGAHVFRHTLATQMLRDGASLREIGQVLRHRDEDTTRIYAKVDLTRLRPLALRWPGGAS